MNSIEKAGGPEQGILVEEIAIVIVVTYRGEYFRSIEMATESTFI